MRTEGNRAKKTRRDSGFPGKEKNEIEGEKWRELCPFEGTNSLSALIPT